MGTTTKEGILKANRHTDVTEADPAAHLRAAYESWCGSGLWRAPGNLVKRRVAPKALATMKAHVREITSRNGGRSLAYVCAALRRYLVGWKAYFRLTEAPSV